MKKKLLAILLALMVLVLAGCEELLAVLEEQAALGFPTAAPAAPAPEGDGISLLFIDVGQADSILVRCGGQSMLVDGGNAGDSDTVATVLKKHGVSELDLVVCTHAHEDHVGGLSGALHTVKVDRAMAPVTEGTTKVFKNFVTAVQDQGLSIEVPKPGDTFALGSARIEVLGPRAEYKDTNDTSIVLMVTYGNTRFLLTGDMEREAEQDLLAAGCDLKADLLKVGHHGSSSSTCYQFLNAVRPAWGVISCETGNDYGHPHQETMSRLRDAEVKLYRTDIQGDILAESDGNAITVTTARNQDVETNPADGRPVPAYYIGNIESRKFHRPDCSGLPAKKNQIRFEDRSEAYKAGYDACSVCRS